MVDAMRIGGHQQGAGLRHGRSMTMRRPRDSRGFLTEWSAIRGFLGPCPASSCASRVSRFCSGVSVLLSVSRFCSPGSAPSRVSRFCGCPGSAPSRVSRFCSDGWGLPDRYAATSVDWYYGGLEFPGLRAFCHERAMLWPEARTSGNRSICIIDVRKKLHRQLA